MSTPTSTRAVVELVKQGERLQGEARYTLWLQAWEALKTRLRPNLRTLNAVENAYLPLLEIDLPRWLEQLEVELGNAAGEDPTVLEKRIAFCSEFCLLFPRDSSVQNMRRALAESYFGVGQPERGDSEFFALAKKFPRVGWVYIAWGDAYAQPRFAPAGTKRNFKRAGEIYQIGIDKGATAADELRARLAMIPQLQKAERAKGQVHATSAASARRD